MSPFSQNAVDEKASHVYDAILAAGNSNLIRPTPAGLADVPPGVDSIGVIEGGESEGGIGVLLLNNDATFWLKDDVFYTVNDEAKALLPDAPHAPTQISDAAVRAATK